MWSSLSVCRKSGRKRRKSVSSSLEILQPSITLKVEELQDDGVSYRVIEKPQTYFNEAKLTAIALSIRFALLDTVTAANGRFLALDDMLISLDMSNRMKVVNYLLEVVVEKYKIYLFTHDKSFYSTLKKRIAIEKMQGEWLFGGFICMISMKTIITVLAHHFLNLLKIKICH